ncbi:MAG: tripartite tricarboxylate transporter substrate binding protein [Hydrogenophaga sp.]|uniref:Bug family tripartite tricarboxylate transporter substrate binding protein n=1 Tax=Hydrogenophaga sp. TaxID=1904254 RepID=UPI0026295FE6|nr:tripartite tricarboxylate transporter substrate binding protein [Hydrogenophaga sp.]MCV0438338.1 tripartite tricarboxylate transporter substrate binding protein [Hydrogenophaga sp.]
MSHLVPKLIAGVASLGYLLVGNAQSYPDRPVRLVVAFAPGGAPDIMARSYAEKLRELVGQPIIVDNKPGATGALGADIVAKAPADGYTLLLNSSAMVINPWVVKQPFDFQKDLAPVIRTAETPYVITVNNNVPARNLTEFIAYAKSNPGKVLCGTYGVASPPHLAMELLKKEAKIDVLHVPYKTFGQALPDLLSGQLTCSIDPPTVAMQQVRAGKIRAIGHTGTNPMESAPELEGIGKRYPVASVVGWQAIFAPAATPEPVLEKLRAEWRKVVQSPEVAQKIRDAGFQPVGDSVEAFSQAIATDYEKFGRVIKENNIRLE